MINLLNVNYIPLSGQELFKLKDGANSALQATCAMCKRQSKDCALCNALRQSFWLGSERVQGIDQLRKVLCLIMYIGICGKVL